MSSDFSPQEIELLQNTIERELETKKTLARSALYEILESDFQYMESYVFEAAVSKAIHSNQLKNLDIKAGRNGGICRSGNNSCIVKIGNTTLKVKSSEKQIYAFVVSVLDGVAIDQGGDVYIGNAGYRLPDKLNTVHIFENFIYNTCKSEKIDISSKEEQVVEYAKT